MACGLQENKKKKTRGVTDGKKKNKNKPRKLS